MNLLFWEEVARIGGRGIQKHDRIVLIKEFGLPILEEAKNRYADWLAQFADTEGSAFAFREVCQQVRRDWLLMPDTQPEDTEITLATPPRLPPARPTAPIPWGIVKDPLVKQMPPLVQCLVEDRLEGTQICEDFGIAGALAQGSACVGNRIRFTIF